MLNNLLSRLTMFETTVDGKKQLKYRQLSEAILSMIDEDLLKPGDHLPTETVLAQALPFSLGTIQQALRNLSELGLVKRTKRKGTIIAERTQEIFDLWQFRFIDKDENSVFPVFSRVLKLDRINQKGPWATFLGEEDSYIRIVREFNVDQRFTAVSYFYLLESQFAPILDMAVSELEGVHLTAVIQRMFGIHTVRTNNRVLCSAIPDNICLHLELPSGARGLHCQILGFAPNDKPLSFQQCYIPADSEPMEFRELKPS